MLRVDAIDVALNTLRAPLSSKSIALPNNMSDLIRIAAEHQETVDRYVQEKKQKPEQLVEAAQFYLQSMILNSGEDAFKTLGLRPGASATDIKDHKRMLLKWLHPDLNKNRWQSALFNRVQTAAVKLQKLEEAELPDVQAVAPQTSKSPHKKSKRKPVLAGYQRTTGRRALLIRSVGYPALTIAVGAAIIYLLNAQFHTGSYLHMRLQQMLPWTAK
jgi:hypothetical protein